MSMQSVRSRSARHTVRVAARVSIALAAALSAAPALADPLSCNLSPYKAAPGLTASVDGRALTLTWDGDKTDEIRLRLGVTNGAPAIQDLSIRRKGGAWTILASNLAPEFRPVNDLPAFGKHHFQIPFDATGKKWVRFAVGDSAGNGAFVQPIKLTSTATTSTGGARR